MKFTIGQVSKMFNISSDTLRYYDKIGVLKPDIDRENNYRYYSISHLENLSLILGIKYLGVPLSEIRDTLESENLEQYKGLIEEQEREIEKNIKKLRELKKAIGKVKERIEIVENFKNEYDFSKLKKIKMDLEFYKILTTDFIKASDERSELLENDYINLNEEILSFIYEYEVQDEKVIENEETIFFKISEDIDKESLFKGLEIKKLDMKGSFIVVDFYGNIDSIDNYIIDLKKEFKCKEKFYLGYKFYLPRKERMAEYLVTIIFKIDE